jgi:hypothetical protein
MADDPKKVQAPAPTPAAAAPRIYHIKVEKVDMMSSDDRAARLLEDQHDRIESAKGTAHVARSFGSGSTVIVLVVPPDIEPATFFPDMPAEEYKG